MTRDELEQAELWRYRTLSDRIARGNAVANLQAKAADEQTRSQATFLLERGIREAVAAAPDLFPRETSPRQLAEMLAFVIFG